MENAGYEKKDYIKLKDFGIKFDFYLERKIKNKEYDKSWKLNYPKELKI